MARNFPVGEKVADFYRYLAEKLIEHPADLKISSKEANNSVVVSVQAHASDHGKLIGARTETSTAPTYKALRTFCQMYSLTLGKNCHIDLQDPWTGDRLRGQPPDYDKDWIKNNRSQELFEILKEICDKVFKLPVNIETVDTQNQTSFSVTLDSSESTSFKLEKIDEDLEVIFHAIGKFKGRRVYVDLSKNQPRTINEQIQNTNDEVNQT